LKISIVIEAPDLAKAILELAASLSKRDELNIIENNPGDHDQKDTYTNESNPRVTLEQVRAQLAALVESGKQKEVKELISRYGVRKLAEVPPEKYSDLLKDIEQIRQSQGVDFSETKYQS
jgi:Tfp pilus assembly protein PilO